MKNCKILLLLCTIVVIPFNTYAYYVPANDHQAGYFQKFFVKEQPQEYYNFPPASKFHFNNKTNQVFLNYFTLEDFSKPNTWSIISPSMQFKNTNTNIEIATDKDLLKWKSIDENNPNYQLVPPFDRQNAIRETPPSLLGIRSLFIDNATVSITVYPKETLYIPNYDTYFLEMWVFGLKQNYDIYINVVDYTGGIHRVYMGNTLHYAWKRLRGEMKSSKLNGLNPSLIYTKVFDTRMKLHSIVFESQNNMTKGFFGTWIGDLGVLYKTASNMPESISSNPATALATSFDWDIEENPAQN